MRPFLLYKQYGADKRTIPNESELIQDLNLNTVFREMAGKDAFIQKTVREVLLNSITDLDTLLYRQEILADCIGNRKVIRGLFRIASEAVKEAAAYRVCTKPNYAKEVSVAARVITAVGLLELLVAKLEALKDLSDANMESFASRGLCSFGAMLAEYLTDEFFHKVKRHIAQLKCLSERGKLVIGAKVGLGIKGARYVLRGLYPESDEPRKRKARKAGLGNQILLDNTSMAKSAREMEEAALIQILKILNPFMDNTLCFFEMLRAETGFYTGCLNLYETLSRIGIPVCFPKLVEQYGRNLSFKGLVDVSLAIEEGKKPVDNELEADGKLLFVITGANQGGKSTFLRSIGLAQLFMQCGMFIPASYFRANVCTHIFTHFTREEDADMNSGKLDEELSRMDRIIRHITSDSLLLMNETFATTTEREGSRIAKDIISALYEHGIKVLFVTHLYEFAHRIHGMDLDKAAYLRAERKEDSSRSFVIKVGEPLPTSYGEDLFNDLLGVKISTINQE